MGQSAVTGVQWGTVCAHGTQEGDRKSRKTSDAEKNNTDFKVKCVLFYSERNFSPSISTSVAACRGTEDFMRDSTLLSANNQLLVLLFCSRRNRGFRKCLHTFINRFNSSTEEVTI